MEGSGAHASPAENPGEGIRRTSGLAGWSFALALLGVCLWIPALPGLALGIMALVKIRAARGRLSGSSLAWAGVAISAAALFAAPFLFTTMIPVATRALQQAEEAKAQDKAFELRASLLGYFEEYGHLPFVQQPQDDIATASEGGLIQVLLGRSRELNPRGKVFLAGPGDRILDPWGRPYQILLDGNRDGRVTLPAGEGGNARTVEAGVVVRSCGPDGRAGGRDDILAY